MSDYRNPNFDYRDPYDPLRDDARFDPDARSAKAAWGWIAAAVFLVVVLAIAFGVGHQGQLGTNTASNDTVSPPAMTRVTSPAASAPTTSAPTTSAPTMSAPTAPAPTVIPAPNTPAQRSQ